MATCSSADSVLDAASQIKSNATKLNTFVNGTASQTVQLGTGNPTPTLRKLVADAQDVVTQAALDAGQTVLDDVVQNAQNIAALQSGKADKVRNAVSGNLAKLDSEGNLRDAGRAAEDFVGLLSYSNDQAVELAWQNELARDVYDAVAKHESDEAKSLLASAGTQCVQFKNLVHEQIDRFDVGYAQKRLQERLLDGTNPTSSSKPVLFLTASPGLKPICDPMARDWMTFSAWPSFARRFWALTNRQLILINVANGGAGVADYGNHATNSWADNEYAELRPRAEGIWADFSQIMAPGSYDVGGIIWYQGETDGSAIYLNMINAAQYIAATLDVFSWARNLIGDASAHVFVCKTCYSGDYMTIPALKAAQEQIQVAQDEICQEENVHMAFSMTPRFADAWSVYMRPDGAHCNSYGYSIIGKGVARGAAHVLGL